MADRSFVDAVVMGTIQGATEFLPISSDGHLSIGRAVLGLQDEGLAETLVLHVGTLIATFLVLRKEVAELATGALAAARSGDWGAPAVLELRTVLVASVPTALIGLGLRDVVERTSNDPWVVAACLLVSAAFVASTARTGSATGQSLDIRQAVLLGVVQGLAVLPGWSRSGSTIATGMALGLAPAASFRLSFLLSLPAVAGACLLELRDPAVLAAVDAVAITGAATAFATGALALHALRGVVARGRFAWFAAYLVPLALAVAVYAASSR